jgi:hypothetical protein
MTSRLTRTFSGHRRQRRNQEMPSISTAAMTMGAEPSPTSAPVVSAPFNPTQEVHLKPPHVRIVPSLESPGQSLIFSVIEMDLENGYLVKIGRFTDRRNVPNRVTFRSKVVSRAHAEMWSEGRKVRIETAILFLYRGVGDQKPVCLPILHVLSVDSAMPKISS